MGVKFGKGIVEKKWVKSDENGQKSEQKKKGKAFEKKKLEEMINKMDKKISWKSGLKHRGKAVKKWVEFRELKKKIEIKCLNSEKFLFPK